MYIGTSTVAALFAVVGLAGGSVGGPAAPAPTVSVGVLGDSYAEGFGADPAHAWEHYTAAELGWSLDAVRADPGGGYLQGGQRGSYLDVLTADPLPATLDTVVVQGGFNDQAYGPAEMAVAVARTLDLVHAQAPHATVTVVGTFDPRPEVYAELLPNLRGTAPTIRQVTEARGDRYIDGLQFTFEVSPDGVHPTPTGHVQLGYAIAAVIEQGTPAPAAAAAPQVRGAGVIGVSGVGSDGVRYFRSASTSGGRLGPVTTVAFGEAGDVPALVPNGAGGCSPAVYRPSAGMVLVRSPLTGDAVASVVPEGQPGDQLVQNAPYGPAASGMVLMRRPEAMTFYSATPGTTGGPDVGVLSFGDQTDRGFLSTSTSTGTTLGVHRPDSSTFYLADPGSDASAPATTLTFGNAGDQGLVGAWGGRGFDGSDHVGVFRPSTGQWFLADTPTPVTGGPAAPITSVTSFAFGGPGDTALACDPR